MPKMSLQIKFKIKPEWSLDCFHISQVLTFCVLKVNSVAEDVILRG